MNGGKLRSATKRSRRFFGAGRRRRLARRRRVRTAAVRLCEARPPMLYWRGIRFSFAAMRRIAYGGGGRDLGWGRDSGIGNRESGIGNRESGFGILGLARHRTMWRSRCVLRGSSSAMRTTSTVIPAGGGTHWLLGIPTAASQRSQPREALLIVPARISKKSIVETKCRGNAPHVRARQNAVRTAIALRVAGNTSTRQEIPMSLRAPLRHALLLCSTPGGNARDGDHRHADRAARA